jgi:hypothetical protein
MLKRRYPRKTRGGHEEYKEMMSSVQKLRRKKEFPKKELIAV